MTRNSTTKKLELEDLGRRHVEVDFSAGQVSSEGGGLLLREVDRSLRITRKADGLLLKTIPRGVMAVVDSAVD